MKETETQPREEIGMSASSSTISPGWFERVFIAAITPARVVGRWHADLWNAVVVDAATFAAPGARIVFVLLAALAIGYPVAASIVHAVGAGPPRADSLTSALRPFFDHVYSESLPFMVAGLGIGLFSPALGVLFMAVFIPADLYAASRSTIELRALQKFGWFPAPVFGRMISYVLLWLLVVEIPLRARAWSSAWAVRAGRDPSWISGAAGRICATALLVYFWARAHPWLIRTVFSWTPLQFTFEASTPTWNEWPILVSVAAVIACVSAIWPRPAQAWAAPAGPIDPSPPRSLSQVLVRQTVAVFVLVGLLAGVLTTAVDTAILIAGLIVAGPVLTVMMSRVRVPAAVAGAPTALRWAAAMVVSLTLSWAILRLTGDAIHQSTFVLVVILAVVAPVFRLLLEAGAGRPAPAPAQVSRPEPPAPVAVWLMPAGILVCSLVFPSAAWADDCPAELGDCLRAALASPIALLGGALGTFAAWMAAASRAWFASQPSFVQDEIRDQMKFARDVYRQNKERRDSIDDAIRRGDRNPNAGGRRRK
jgi:hypothetical protein